VPKTVFTILLENHDYNEVVGSSNAPYLNSLIAQYGLATNYMDSGSHPSLPNYLYLISGDTQYNSLGFLEYDPTPLVSLGTFPVSGDNLGNQLTAANVPWRSYQESMGTACTLASAGNFVCRHDPFLYFTNIQSGANGLCAKTNVDYAQFAADLASNTFRYLWITPNLLDDGHDPQTDPVTGLKQTDAWLSTEVPKILASNAWKDAGVLFITWDEAEGRNGDSADQVPMIIVTPGIKSAGYKSSVAYEHANYLATVEDIFGLPRLGAAVGKASMSEFWQ
jgi:phospholipase C